MLSVMKNYRLLLVILLSLTCLLTMGKAQNANVDKLRFEVNLVYEPLSISKIMLDNADSLQHINPHYKPSWVKEYYSVTICGNRNGKRVEISEKNEVLSQEQKELMYAIDEGTPIDVRVHYLPDNTLKNNDPKEFSFSFLVNPDQNAEFPGGEEALMAYLKEKAVDHIAAESWDPNVLASVKFTVTKTGEVENIHVEHPSKDASIDDLLVAALQEMPAWLPARYKDGTPFRQDYVFNVGNLESCLMNFLHVRRELYE